MSSTISGSSGPRALLSVGSVALAVLAACGNEANGDAGQVGGTGGTAAGRAGGASGGREAGAGAGAGAGAAAGGSGKAGARGGGDAGSAAGGSAGRGGAAGAGAGRGGAGLAGGPGAAGQSGAGGAPGGRGGSGGAAAGSAGMPDAGAGNAPSSGCAGRDLLICEDFEGTAVGGVPDGWTRHGDLAAVSDDDAHGGSHALKLGASDSSERRIYHDATLLGSAHWGRIYYKVKTPTPDAFVHSTMVSLIGDGPKNGRSDYRPIDTVKQAIDTPDVGGRHNFIYNVQIIGSSEFGTETSYDYHFDATWHCAEYHLQASDQSYALYLDGAQILSFTRGAGNYDKSDIPDSFSELRVGWINYQSAPPGFTAWIDDVAFDDQRIGCD